MYKNHGEGTTTSIVVGGKLRVQTSYPSDGCERVEEWISGPSGDVGGLTLSSRKWRVPQKLNVEPDWEFEIGAPKSASHGTVSTLAASSSLNPVWTPNMTKTHFTFVLSNAPWDRDNYSVSVVEGGEELVLRTKNKKFYKKWKIPSMVRASERLEEGKISYECVGEAKEKRLVVSYLKPASVLASEERASEEREKSLKGQRGVGGGGGDGGNVDCKQS